MKGARIRAALALFFVFAAGAVAGVFFERHHAIRQSAGTVAFLDAGAIGSETTTSGQAEHDALLAEMRQAVGLDEEQMAAIDAILAVRQHAVQQMWEQLRPEVQSAMHAVHAEVAELLRADQLELYHDWLTRRRAHGLPH